MMKKDGKMRKHLIAEMTLSEFKESLEFSKTAIFPVGATEGYGHHLPLGSDWLVTYDVARRTAEKAGCFVAPPVTYGFSEDLMCYPGTLTVSTQTLIAVYSDVLESLHRQGIQKVLFLCGHVSNVGSVDQASMDAIKKFGMECAIIDWWRFVYHINEDLMDSNFPVGHAAEAGTSVLLHTFPHLVVKENMILNEKEDKEEVPDLYVYEYYDQVTKSSVLGDPFAGTEEKGRLMIEKAVDTIAKFLKEW